MTRFFMAALIALAARDYARAANYMDTTLPPGANAPTDPRELARRLQVLLDHGGSSPLYARTLQDDGDEHDAAHAVTPSRPVTQ